jgi:endo-1,4-beta-D-glucanase Y
VRRGIALCGVLLFGMLAACGDRTPRDPSHDVLRDAWDSYKKLYITTDGNVIDRDRGGGQTTSEGQGYALLRAAWMRDQATFARVFEWTERHLKRPDGLYSWLWDPGTGRIADANTAADADQEIAFALIVASHAFANPQFLDRAREILQAIRSHERVDVGAGWFPAAGNWAVDGRIVNLSYFVPYAYPYFARVDPAGKWDVVADTGYDLIYRTLRTPPTRMIPDFMVVTEQGDPAPLADASGLSSVFSSDGMRIYWRWSVLHEVRG